LTTDSTTVSTICKCCSVAQVLIYILTSSLDNSHLCMNSRHNCRNMQTGRISGMLKSSLFRNKNNERRDRKHLEWLNRMRRCLDHHRLCTSKLFRSDVQCDSYMVISLVAKTEHNDESCMLVRTRTLLLHNVRDVTHHDCLSA
jgi:hypothetical protein